MKFKIGDKVRQIDSGWNTSAADIGKKARVIGVEDFDGEEKIEIKQLGLET